MREDEMLLSVVVNMPDKIAGIFYAVIFEDIPYEPVSIVFRHSIYEFLTTNDLSGYEPSKIKLVGDIRARLLDFGKKMLEIDNEYKAKKDKFLQDYISSLSPYVIEKEKIRDKLTKKAL